MLGTIFRKAQNKIQDPDKLRRLIVDLIDKEQWSSLSSDLKGDAYEGLLQKNAEDVKGGAGQYFTPRALIAAMVEVMAPQPGQTVCDPACGTGGFLLAAHDYIAKRSDLTRTDKKLLKSGTLFGIELVDGVTRLCAMNLLLHGRRPRSSPRTSRRTSRPPSSSSRRSRTTSRCDCEGIARAEMPARVGFLGAARPKAAEECQR